MSSDLDVSAGNIIDGTESIEQVGRRLFEHITKVAGGEVHFILDVVGYFQ